MITKRICFVSVSLERKKDVWKEEKREKEELILSMLLK